MDYDLEKMEVLTGTLTTLDNASKVNGVYLKIDSNSAIKLAKVLRKNIVTRENQELLFDTIMIDKDCKDVFIRGQSDFVKKGNQYTMSSDPRNPVSFQGELQTAVLASDGQEHLCKIEIGKIIFDLKDIIPETDDEVAIFENVTAMIYPSGKYYWKPMDYEE